MPLAPASLPRLRILTWFQSWTSVAVISCFALFAALSYVRIEQSRTLQAAHRVLDSISQARVDLSLGFLHVVLGADKAAPFQMDDGLARIDRAIDCLRAAEIARRAGQKILPEAADVQGDFDLKSRQFRADLATWIRSPADQRAELGRRIQVELRELEQLAVTIENASELEHDLMTAHLNESFGMMLAISGVLSCGICAAIYLLGRNQRRAVKAMMLSERRLRIVGDHLPDGYVYQFARTPEGKPHFTFISAGVERVHGLSVAECLRNAASLLELMDPEDVRRMETLEAQSVQALSPFSIDVKTRDRKGEQRILHFRSQPVRDEQGEVIWAGLALDVTERRRAEDASRKTEALLHEMGAAAKIGGWEFDVLTGERFWTKEVYRIYDVDPDIKPTLELGLKFYTEEARPRLVEAMKEAVEHGTPYNLNLEFVSARGIRKWVKTIGRPVIENGRVVRLRGSLQDITELKQAEIALQEREQLFQLFVEHSPAAIAMLDTEMKYLVLSRRWISDYGLGDQDLAGRSHYEVFPEIAEQWKEIHRRCLQGAIERCDADRFVRGDGSVDWVRWEIVPWRKDDGAIGGIIIFSEVITQQREAEEALRRKEQNYEALFNAANDAIFVHDSTTGRILDVNEAMVRLYGYSSREEVIQRHTAISVDAEPPYSWNEAREKIRRAVEEGPQVFKWRARRSNGERFWAEVSLRSSQIDGQSRVLAVVRDISVRMAYECEIERLNRLYSTLSEVNQIIVRCQSPEELFTRICRVLIEFGKMRSVEIAWRDSVTGQMTPIACHTADGGSVSLLRAHVGSCELYRELLETSEPVFSNHALTDPRTACCLAAMREIGIHSCATFPIRLHGEICGAFSIGSGEEGFFNEQEMALLREVAEDISHALDLLDQQEQRQRAAEERKRLTTAMEQIGESIVITNVQGDIVYVNPAFEKITGYTQQEVLGQNPRLLQSGRHNDDFYRAMWQTLSRGDVWHGRFVNRKKDGSIFSEDATISPVRSDAGEIISYVAVKRDITREVELEAQVLHAQKMEGVGQLAGGVAHDFNNILAAIMMQAQLTETTDQLPASVIEDMQLIRQSCERGANLTRQLLLFSRKQVMQPRDIDLNESVTTMIRMLQRLIGENISIELNFSGRPLVVHADPGMLDQVLLNLSVNGRDAMEGHGRLTIETSERFVDAAAAASNPEASPGPYVCLAVSDTGCGIPAELLPRVFEPFFTTKEQGKGTGLGLATVFGIVKQHHGWIDVKTHVGRGTRFEIYLPAAKATTSSLVTLADTRNLKGTETILLAEDDFSVRMITRKFLEMHGYRVLDASNGVEALKLWHEHRAEINLLLTDLLMPEGMNGSDLAREVRAVRPDLKVIYFSGYSADVFKGLELPPGDSFLQKPVPPQALLEAVRLQLSQ